MNKIDEQAIERGLNIREYPGRWNDAKDIALRREKDDYPEGSASEYAFRLFVELGGETKSGFYGLLEEGSLQ